MGYLDVETSDAITARRNVISRMRRRNALRTAYFDGEQRLSNLGVTIPPQMESLATVVGWPKKAVKVRSDRLHPEGFRLPRESELLERVDAALDSVDFDVIDSQARETALQYGCSFVFSSLDERGNLVLSLCTPENATANIDRRTGKVTSGLEMHDWTHGTFFMEEHIWEIEQRGNRWYVLEDQPARGRTTCTVYTHDATVRRPFGQSAITRPVMGYTDAAVRTMLRQEVSAEFYSSPQRYMLGADPSMFEDENGNIRPAWETILGSLLVAPDHIDEETLERVTPSVGQFTQMSMQPHSDHLRSIAMMFAGETSIPPSRLGVLHDNPASAQAMLADEADLITATEAQIPGFSRARKSLALDVASLIREKGEDPEAEFAQLTTRWRDPATPNAQSQAQAVTMLVSNGIIPAQSRVTWEMMGFDDSTIRRLEDDMRRAGNPGLLATLRAAADDAAADPTVADLASRRGTETNEPDARALEE